jgi:hypothetical protein
MTKMKIRNLLCVLSVSTLALVCGSRPPEPQFENQLFVESSGAYTFAVPREWKLITDKKDIAGLSLQQTTMTIDLIALQQDPASQLTFFRHDMSPEFRKAGVGRISQAQFEGFVQAMLKQTMPADFSARVEQHKTRRGLSGQLIQAEKDGDLILLFTVARNPVIYAVALRASGENAPARERFAAMLETLDLSPAGVKAAREELASRDKTIEEYKKALHLSDRDGFFTGLWNGFAMPFKFGFNHVGSNKGKYVYVSEHHTAITYWVGVVLGFVPGLTILLSMMFGSRR